MQEAGSRRTQAERRAETRKALLDAARELIVEKGYAETGTPEIVAKAEVTRGALYHHFADKADLMRALVRREAAAIAREIDAGTSPGQPPLEALMAGANAYFSAMAVPGRARIMLLEGPAVLGLAEMADIDRDTGGATLLEGLRHAASHGALQDVPLAPLAALLSAAFDRAALAIAGGEDRQPYETATRQLLAGVLKS
ncbi:TetR/AcrR family transcriptional regulator [Roseibium salinum]|uniref:Helix-turn-helix domain containing protein n=1 Tax=Roseibium salinum TaxID=1604349 RepID=A0ABT3QYR5_9HYPH|nr:TetR/AcrR family transcriptional regulator [Roseibium sp. DSM 29163]MCX2722097.1 helix-turn-helix domain containing protein [Roseibium sp. DSM 29163]MDN3719884.1 helix-turn-helix domain-containing protein [Roseibium salinum]